MYPELYPLKFNPISQYRIWGGTKLNKVLPEYLQMENLGEIWCLSGVSENVSIVENGELKGKNLNEIIEIYKDQLLGRKVWEKFGSDFPLLIKFIDAAEPLSVQVHPNDEQAKRLHNSFGKSEMWYIMDAEAGSELIIGFENGITKEDYSTNLENETLESILHREPVEKGDAVYIPSGRVHAIGKGIVLAEIQQTSDITYRIYDYNRTDKDGKKRELHTANALDAIDFNPIENIKSAYARQDNEFNELINSPYFKTCLFEGNQRRLINNEDDEFLIYICTEGNAKFIAPNFKTELSKYECMLIPACIKSFAIQPEISCTLIQVKVP